MAEYQENATFQITRTASTVRATELFIETLDLQIAELDAEKSRLQDLRAHAARTIGKDRNGQTRMQRVLQSADRSITEGKGATIEEELARETEKSLELDNLAAAKAS